MHWSSIAAAAVLLLGCTSDHRTATADSGTTGDDGSTPAPGDGGPEESCNAPDRECPEAPPVTGGRCEGELSCEYDDGSLAECLDGSWQSYGCPGCAPPLAEGCRPPFEGTLEGATVRIGPGSPTDRFRPFVDGERIRPVFGAQGGSMVQLRVDVDHDTLPTCVAITANLSIDGTASAPASFPLRLHCGQSLRVFLILAEDPCDERDYDVEIGVEAAGIGSTSANLVLEGSACPGPAG